MGSAVSSRESDSTDRRIEAASMLPQPDRVRFRFKSILWGSLGLTTLFVFITSEVLLVTDYPMYHAYRLQVIADRQLLIPHTLAGIFALLIGPINFSSRIRQRHLQLHRVLGRIYVVSVFVGSFTGIALAAGRPGLPGTSMQAAAWMVCTTAAFITARNRDVLSAVGVIAFTLASLLIVEIGLNWHELTTRRV
jgi:hypothetical protein